MSGRAFRRRSVLDRAPGSGVPNMTPMVDVTLVILIFFMASATIAGPEWFLRAGLPPEQPAPAGGLSLPSPVVRIEVFERSGVVMVRGFGEEGPIDGTLGTVAGLDRAVAKGLVVEIRSGDSVPYADVVRLHAALAERGAEIRLR